MDSENELASMMSAMSTPGCTNIMAGSLLPRDRNKAMAERELKQYEEKCRKSSRLYSVSSTKAAPLTHGLAPNPKELSRTSLSDLVMRVGMIHESKVLFVKTIAEPLSVVGLKLLVEDLSDPTSSSTIFLNAYNIIQPVQPKLDEDYPVGTYLAILQPYPRFARDDPSNAVTLRCDNPQCIVFFGSQAECKLAMNENKWPDRNVYGSKDPPKNHTSNDEMALCLCEKGNKQFAQKRYNKALQAYEEALTFLPTSELRVRILSNRSATFLNLGLYSEALSDANEGLSINPSHIKLRYRKITALLCLQKPNEAKKECESALSLLLSSSHKMKKKPFLDLKTEVDIAISKSQDDSIESEPSLQFLMSPSPKSEHKPLLDLETEVDIALAENRGDFDLKSLKKEVGLVPKELSRRHQDYVTSSMSLRRDNNIGRGWFATSEIPTPGTFLLVEKAYAFSRNEGDNSNVISLSGKTMDHGSKAQMVYSVIQKLLRHPSKGKNLYSLTAGSRYETPVDDSDSSKVDVLRIKNILSSNWFDASSISNDVIRAIESERESANPSNQLKTIESSREATGLWINASFFNHSCAPNAECMVIGDFIFVYTVKPVAEHEELTIPYCNTNQSFEQRTLTFAQWNSGDGFLCRCNVCRYLRENKSVLEIEQEIDRAYDKAIEYCSQGFSMESAASMAMPSERMDNLIAILENLPPEGQGGLRKLLELRTFCQLNPDEAVRCQQKSLAVIDKIIGRSPASLDRVKCLFRIASLALMAGKQCVAREAIEDVYCTLCMPPLGVFDVADVETLAKRYVTSYPPMLPQVRRIIKNVASNQKRLKKSPRS